MTDLESASIRISMERLEKDFCSRDLTKMKRLPNEDLDKYMIRRIASGISELSDYQMCHYIWMRLTARENPLANETLDSIADEYFTNIQGSRQSEDILGMLRLTAAMVLQ